MSLETSIEDGMQFEQVARQEAYLKMQKEFERLEITKASPQQRAMDYIEYCKTQVGIMGANDSEVSALEALRGGLEEGKIKPAEAMQAAEKILFSKMDYH